MCKDLILTSNQPLMNSEIYDVIMLEIYFIRLLLYQQISLSNISFIFLLDNNTLLQNMIFVKP